MNLCDLFNNFFLEVFLAFYHGIDDQRDLEYWAIDELIMEPCCALKYFPKIEVDFSFIIELEV